MNKVRHIVFVAVCIFIIPLFTNCLLLGAFWDAMSLSDSTGVSSEQNAVSNNRTTSSSSTNTTKPKPTQQQEWLWYSASIGHRTNSNFGTKEYESGFWYRIVYRDDNYCFCISKDRKWYLRDSRGHLTRIDTSDVPDWIREMVN